jgi:hypothetical protein
MGFEHRQAVRIKAGFHLFYWLGHEPPGPGVGAQADNLSVSGMAFSCQQELAKGQALLIEAVLASGPVRLGAQVLRSEALPAGGQLVRVVFTAMDGDSRLRLRQHVLQVADPDLAAATGWGKAYFVDQRVFEAEYRELPPGLVEKWLAERSYLDAKGLVYLKGFQGFLEGALGARIPGAFKLLGSRALKPGAVAWLELRLPSGDLHLLATSLWLEAEPGQKAIVGLQPLAYHKEEALQVEKGPGGPDPS